MNAGEIAVEATGLTRRFGDFVAVDNIDLTVPKGEIFGFLGPNGAGKSTTIKMLCGLLLPSAGRGTVGGHDLMTGAEMIKKTIGYMSQRFSLYDDLTVAENIDFYSGIYGVPRDRSATRKEWVLGMSGLAARGTTITKNLAAGFKQRLALGCALLHEPPILFLDEPTSGVDPLSRRAFWGLIHDMAQAGTTVFVTTHYMDEADYCDRLALIYRGRIIAEGSPAALRQEHMKRDVLEISVDRVIEALDLLAGNGIETAVFGRFLHATVDTADEGKPRIARMLEDAGIAVRHIEKITPSLEDVFVSLIGVA